MPLCDSFSHADVMRKFATNIYIFILEKERKGKASNSNRSRKRDRLAGRKGIV
jgi:hypothetical protein